MSVLTDKKYIAFKGISRYSSFPVYYHTIDKKWVGATTKYLSNNTQSTTYRVEVGDTYDNLALHYYNNPSLYWVICSFNHIQDPFTDPTPGTLLQIPVLSNISYGD